MSVVQTKVYKSPVGELIIGSFQDRLCLCDWMYRDRRTQIDTRIRNGLKAKFENGDSYIIDKTINQLDEYFRKSRKVFDIDLLLVGTEFQKMIWEELMNIKFGEKKTYKYLAEIIGYSMSIRAVAAANAANAVSIIVPCHRVIGSNGKLIGYAGGLNAKLKLLELENENNQLYINI